MEFEGKLSDYAEVVMGQSPSGENVSAQIVGPPLLNGPTEFGPSHPRPVQWTRDPKKFAKSGNILFCVRGSTTGRMNWADQTYAIGRGLAAIRGKNGFDIRFIRGVIETGLPDLLALATGSTFPNVGRDDLLAIPAPMISCEGSIAIGSVLKAINDRIDHNRVLAANLEAIARRLFKSWFVDFDPVRAKAAGEKPSGLADDIAVLFPDRFVESELGEIPEGWAFNPLSSIAEFVNGRNFTKDATGTGRMIIRIAELSNGGPTGSTVWNDLPRTAEQYLANPGNILFAWSGSLGIHVWDRNTGLVNQHIFKVIPKPPFAAPFVFFATEDLVDDFRAIAAGKAVTMGHIKRNDLDTHGVTCPSAPELITAFHKIVAPLWDRVRVARREALTLGSIRDLLLPRLISGKLRVEDVVSLVEETIA